MSYNIYYIYHGRELFYCTPKQSSARFNQQNYRLQTAMKITCKLNAY